MTHGTGAPFGLCEPLPHRLGKQPKPVTLSAAPRYLQVAGACNEPLAAPARPSQVFWMLNSGYFSDSCCSHPLSTPAELEEKDALGVRHAACRCLQAELGIPPDQISPDDIVFMTIYHHRAKSDRIWGDHEICYLLLVRKDVTVNPDPSEAKSYQYMTQEELEDLLERDARGEAKVTPWLRSIAEKFLFKWWPHLDELAPFMEHHRIHRV
ncbi:isopentenyl-diphosphate delta-isomerase 2-like [Talpa occidentalis]|uniref:isopentenyl-diphosphate delta-isomerase 2-like n=1 Tax=Talpa occidentalis TaxID=50954 RepID=UPI00188E654C|nr:isopentenyl-diphosphate delta-isomerase 2-like [Talpa occidentalis]